MNGDRHKYGNRMSDTGEFGNGNRSSTEIRDEIDQTRRDIDHTLDEIGDRLSPRHVIDEILSAFRGSTPSTSNATAKITEKIKRHPVPAALIGVGVAWLLMEEEEGQTPPRRRQWRRRERDVDFGGQVHDDIPPTFPESTSPPYGGPGVPPRGRGERLTRESLGSGAGSGWTETGEQMKDRAKGWGRSARERISSAAGRLSQRVSSARNRTSEAVSSTSHGIRDMGDRASRGLEGVRQSASDAAYRARSSLERGRERIEEVSQEHPLAMGVGCAALGMLAGLLIPRTRVEDERMGAHAEEFKRQVRRTGNNLMEEAKDIASDTAQAAREEMQRQGVTSEHVSDKASRVAGDIRNSATESAKNEGLTTDDLGKKAESVIKKAGETARCGLDEAKAKREGKPNV